MHKLLTRQIRRCFGSMENTAPELQCFIAAVDEAYAQADSDRALLEHSMETVSGELISRYQQLQDALSAAEQKSTQLKGTLSLLAATLESTADGILVVDAEGHIVQTNRKFAELWRIPASVLATRDDDLVLEYVLDQLAEPELFLARVHALYSQPDAESFDTVLFKDGRVFERYSTAHHVGGDTVGRVWSFRDVTARMQLEDQLRQSQKMEAVGSLAGGVAHDFNNLLTVIRGHADMLLDDADLSSTQRADVEVVLRATSRASDLTRQLLAFSRKQILKPEVLDLNDVVRGVASMLQRLIGEDITIVSDLNAGPCCVMADPGQLEQVIVNLAVNARDAMPQGGRITIETECARIDDSDEVVRSGALAGGSYCVLRVSDTGDGIPRALRARIFEPFFTTKEAGKGTGLGLATVYGIVQQSDGAISFDSEEGVGTSFRVLLPQTMQQPARASVAVPRAHVQGSETVLLAEDEDAVRSYVKRALTRLGYSVIAASSGDEATRLAATHDGPIQLLITDVVMPGMSGRELVETVRSQRPELAALYMSGYTDDEILRRGVIESDAAFLQKPFHSRELALAVRQAIHAAA